MEGYEKLKESVMKDCSAGQGCFNPNGCNHEFYRTVPQDNKIALKLGMTTATKCVSKCFHRYCDKFKWVIDRAQHYAEKLGVTENEILDAWERDRNYWYMNYYQDSNQPEIKGNKVRVFNTVDKMVASIGDKGFRCPACGEKTTNPYECNSGKEKKGVKCDWKVYGLFGDFGKGVFVFIKDKLKGEQLFMPIAWEEDCTKTVTNKA